MQGLRRWLLLQRACRRLVRTDGQCGRPDALDGSRPERPGVPQPGYRHPGARANRDDRAGQAG